MTHAIRPRVAIVTGSTQGLGRAAAIALMERSVAVMICAPEIPDDWADGLPLDRAQAAAFPCDIRNSDDVTALWAAAERELGRVDILVNNAGLALTGVKLADLADADFRAMVEINVIGTMNMTRVALAAMLNGPRDVQPVIANMLGAGWDGVPVPGMNGYATSKSGVTFMTRALAAEHAGDPITIFATSPGVVMTQGLLREHAKVPTAARAGREAVLNIIGDHPETIGEWIADLALGQGVDGENHVWLTPDRIAARQAQQPPRDILSRYRGNGL